MPEVVRSEGGAPDRGGGPRPADRPLPVRLAEGSTLGSGEEPLVGGPAVRPAPADLVRRGGERDRPGPAALERVDVEAPIVAAREHGALEAQTGSGDLDEVAHAQTRQRAPAQPTEPENGDQIGGPARRSTGEVVELVESEELPLAAHLRAPREGYSRRDVAGEPAVRDGEGKHGPERAEVAVGGRGRAAALDETTDPVGDLGASDRRERGAAEARLDVVPPPRLVGLARLALQHGS